MIAVKTALLSIAGAFVLLSSAGYCGEQKSVQPPPVEKEIISRLGSTDIVERVDAYYLLGYTRRDAKEVNEEVLDYLAIGLNDEHPLVRYHVYLAIALIGPKAGRLAPNLWYRVQNPDGEVDQRTPWGALCSLGDASVPYFLQTLGSGDERSRLDVLDHLLWMRTRRDDVLKELERLSVEDPSQEVAEKAKDVLAQLKDSTRAQPASANTQNTAVSNAPPDFDAPGFVTNLVTEKCSTTPK